MEARTESQLGSMQGAKFLEDMKRIRERRSQEAEKRKLRGGAFNLTSFEPVNQEPTSFDSDAIEDSDPMFPKIRLVSRYCSKENLAAAFPAHTETLTITELYKQVSPPEFKRPVEASPNFVVFGIVATRSVTRTNSRGNKYVTVLLSDLKYDISLALHGKAHDKFWKVRPGTLVALFNPQFYVQKFENTARTLALSIAKDNCLIEVGQAKDLGQCESMTSASQYAKRCKNWVDVRRSHVCDFHIEQKATKTKRPEFNASSAKLWDPQSASRGASNGNKRLTVYQGGEVSWKRGLQADPQANFGRQTGPKNPFGFPDAPVGRIFQSDTSAASRRSGRYEESLEERKRKRDSDRKNLERVTDDARLKARLGANGAKPDSTSHTSKRVALSSNASSNTPSTASSNTSSNTSHSASHSSSNTKTSAFARTQLRKLGFNPLLASSTPNSGARRLMPAPAKTKPEDNDSDSDDLEII